MYKNNQENHKYQQSAYGHNSAPKSKAAKQQQLFVVLAGAVAVTLAVGIGVAVALSTRTANVNRGEQDTNSNQTADTEGFGNTVYHNGEEYTLNENLTTVLFLGIDQSEDDRTVVVDGGGCSDVMLLFILDDETKTTKILQISRDTMVSVDFYTLVQTLSYSIDMQIAMQYAAGDSPARGCWLAKEKVSQELLYGVPINFTASLTMDGIAPFVDSLGGVTHTMGQDYTYVNPDYQQGATIQLDGAATERFIRYRDINDFGSNNTRMARQTELLMAIASHVRNADQQTLLTTVQNELAPYLESNLDADTIQKLAEYQLQTPFYKNPGENVVGKHDEYHMDASAMKDMVMDLFYKKVS